MLSVSWRSEAGAALIEMMLAFPLLMLLALGAGDFGRVMYTGIVLSHAARAGAAYGSEDNGAAADLAAVRQAARDEARNIGTIGVTARMECECEDGGAVLCDATCGAYGVPRVFTEVQTTFTFEPLVAWPLIPNPVPLSRTARVRVH